jgi:hypothetical protein
MAGVTHHVTVLDDGFDFHGERFCSLSEIARKVTGVRDPEGAPKHIRARADWSSCSIIARF